jgi:Holliday junction resolvasome RuvABC endonuclease subunit
MPKKKALTKDQRKVLLADNLLSLLHYFKIHKPKIIGIDIGTNLTGIHSFLSKTFVLKGGNFNRTKRINEIKKQLIKYLKKAHDHKCIVLMEDYSLGLRATSLYQLAEIGGVVRDVLYESKIPVLNVAPQTLKKFVFGPGRRLGGGTKKQLTLVEVLDRWGIKFDDDNACDAYCLYKFGWRLKHYLIQTPGTSGLKKWEIQMFDDFITNRGKIND